MEENIENTENRKMDTENVEQNNMENIESDTIEENKTENLSDNTNSNTKKSTFFSKKDKNQKKIDELQIELEKVQAEKNEIQDKFLRLYSEFDNYRKRTQKEKLDIIKNASESLIISLLPILDDMERALNYNQQSEVELATVLEGDTLILQKIVSILKQKGLTTIETENAKFNTDYHEAVSLLPAPSEEEKGNIIDVVQKGYMLNEKVIRFAKVVIYQ